MNLNKEFFKKLHKKFNDIGNIYYPKSYLINFHIGGFGDIELVVKKLSDGEAKYINIDPNILNKSNEEIKNIVEEERRIEKLEIERAEHDAIFLDFVSYLENVHNYARFDYEYDELHIAYLAYSKKNKRAYHDYEIRNNVLLKNKEKCELKIKEMNIAKQEQAEEEKKIQIEKDLKELKRLKNLYEPNNTLI